MSTSFDRLMEESTLEDTAPVEAPQARLERMKEGAAPADLTQFFETCPKCRGSGQFRGYTGMSMGSCFKCKGAGKLSFKTSPEHRAATRNRSAAKAEARTQTWAEANPLLWDWMNTRAPSFTFAANMLDAVRKYGHLTENQEAAAEKCRLADIDREARRAQEKIERETNAPRVSIDPVETAFNTAQGNGIKRPKLRLDTFIFSLAPSTGKNAGAVYVKEGGEYLGKVQGGKFMRAFSCTAETEQRIVAVCADPRQAAIAYGQRTGTCSTCGRELTNEGSIEDGIGPICASKYGWGG